MSNTVSETNLGLLLSEIQQLRTTVEQQQAQINQLESHLPTSPVSPTVAATGKSSRRKILKRLAMVTAGAVAGTALAANQRTASAEFYGTQGGDSPTIGLYAVPYNFPVSGGFQGAYPQVGLAASSSGNLGQNPQHNLKIGVYAHNDQENGYALYAKNTNTTPGSTNIGIYSETTPLGTAVHGKCFGASNKGIGVKGESDNGVGVQGNSMSGKGVTCHAVSGDALYGSSDTGIGAWLQTQSGTCGVWGVNYSKVGTSHTIFKAGVYGVMGAGGAYTAGVRGTGANIGVWGYGIGGGVGVYGDGSSSNGYAGYFLGKVHITGTLSKSGGTFKIDHPLDPENKYLSHSFVESPDMLNLYNGVVSLDGEGYAEVRLPNWFESLNSDYRYQLTALGSASPDLHIAGKVADGRFKIAGGQPGQEVSWQVTGIRQDAWAKANPVVVEEEKSKAEQGYFLNPEVFGFGADKHIDINARTEK
jgi:hypothetical protein